MTTDALRTRLGISDKPGITSTAIYCGEGIVQYCTVIIPAHRPPDLEYGYIANIQQAEDRETFDAIEGMLLRETRLPVAMVANLLENIRNLRLAAKMIEDKRE